MYKTLTDDSKAASACMQLIGTVGSVSCQHSQPSNEVRDTYRSFLDFHLSAIVFKSDKYIARLTRTYHSFVFGA